jgi:hypothetical protein
MSGQTEPIERALEGDWWYFAGLALAILAAARARYRVGPAGAGREGVVITIGAPFTSEAAIRITRANDTTALAIIYDPAHTVQMQQIALLLHETSLQAEDVRRTWAPSGEDVIERYYRARAAGGRATLRQIAQDTGFSYGYLRSVKAAYDKAGKWGSKKGMLPGHDNKSGE